MFTGIIEEIGRLESISGSADTCVVRIGASKVLSGTKTGDSIAVNGVCLTARHIGAGFFEADVSRETVDRTSLRSLSAGAPLNLERALRLDSRLGGHVVTGHIDGTGIVSKVSKLGNSYIYEVAVDKGMTAAMVEKGSIAVEGVSLTIATLGDSSFAVSMIPHTRANTNLVDKKPGCTVNLECDIIGKYVMRYMAEGAFEFPQAGREGSAGSNVTQAFLAENGFF